MSKGFLSKGDIVEITDPKSENFDRYAEIISVSGYVAKIKMFPGIETKIGVNHLLFIKRWITY